MLLTFWTPAAARSAAPWSTSQQYVTTTPVCCCHARANPDPRPPVPMTPTSTLASDWLANETLLAARTTPAAVLAPRNVRRFNESVMMNPHYQAFLFVEALRVYPT